MDPDNPVRMIDAFVDELYLARRGFERAQRASTGRPGYAPGTMLKLYVYGYLHQLTSSRKLSGRVTASKSPPAPRQASFPRCPRPTRPQPRPVAWGKQAFIYQPGIDTYRCQAGQ